MKDGEIEGVSYINCPLDWTQTDMMKESKPMIGGRYSICYQMKTIIRFISIAISALTELE